MTNLTPRKRKSEEVRQRLLEAFKAEFEAKGYNDSNLRTICTSAGLTTGAFFANWKGKEDLYVEIYGHKPVTPEQGREMMAMVDELTAIDCRDSTYAKAVAFVSAIKSTGDS